MSRRDIVDEIDALIDDQLAAGETGMARRAAAASDRRCPHCNRDWHGLAITTRMEEMRREYELRTQRRIFAAYMAGEVGEADYAESAILDDYRYADDTSDILCPGSEFIGPMPSTMRRYECQCANCRAMRSYTRIRARAIQDPIVDEPVGYTERFATNPESPWVVYEPVDGDRVGVDIRGNTVVGTVRNVDTTDGTTTFDLTPDNLTDRGWQPFGTISPDTAGAFISETTEPVFDEPARWPSTPPNRATRRGQQEPREPFWTRIRPSRRRRHP